MLGMEKFVWKNPHKAGFNLAYANLFSYVTGMRINEGRNKGTSYQEVLIVNQDGLQRRGLPLNRGDFKKTVMREWHAILPFLPKPFTGKIEVNVHNLIIEEVKFISK